MTCPRSPVGKWQSWNSRSGRHSFRPSVWPQPSPWARSRAVLSPGFHPVHLPSPMAVTWCRSTCCYCGCAGASPRAVRGERMEKGGAQAAGRGPTSTLRTQGLTLEVLARSCCSSWGDVTMGTRHSWDRVSLFCWRRSGRWLTAQPKVTHLST